MKYKLIKKATERADIDSIILNIIANPDVFYFDSILETDDRIIVRYVRRALPTPDELVKLQPFNSKVTAILYIHSSKKDHTFTKICCYELEEDT